MENCGSVRSSKDTPRGEEDGKGKQKEEIRMNICLIGMPSSGKSVLGKMLAKRRKMTFLDLDTLIQKNTGKLLREIIAEEGREGFLRLEFRELFSWIFPMKKC